MKWEKDNATPRHLKARYRLVGEGVTLDHYRDGGCLVFSAWGCDSFSTLAAGKSGGVETARLIRAELAGREREAEMQRATRP